MADNIVINAKTYFRTFYLENLDQKKLMSVEILPTKLVLKYFWKVNIKAIIGAKFQVSDTFGPNFNLGDGFDLRSHESNANKKAHEE